MTFSRTRRLSPNQIGEDIDCLNGLRTVEGYSSPRPEATLEAIEQAYNTMLDRQREATELEARYRAAIDDARDAEYEFHDSIIAMKEVVRGIFGSDSNAAQAVGLRKRSEYRRPNRSASTTES